MQTTARRTAGTVIFVVGLVIGLGLALAPIWGDLEGMSYFASGAGYDQFGGLHCPILMGPYETATITARLDNSSDKVIQPYYEGEISGVSATRSLEGQTAIAPHDSKIVQWTVDANDIDIGYFVMNKFDVLPFAGNPAREATCGILVLNLGGFGGGQIVGWGLALSLIGMVLGLAVWESARDAIRRNERSMQNGLRATGVSACLAMLTGFMGWWLPGLILCAITILLAVILLRLAVS